MTKLSRGSLLYGCILHTSTIHMYFLT